MEEGEESYPTNFVPTILQQKSGGNEVAMVRGRGEQGASWNVMQNTGKRPVHTRDVGVFFL